MCGVAGILHFDGAPVDRENLKCMTDSLAHRGPDGQGSFVSGFVGLGHRRLAIIDLSSAGEQPMTNENGTIWITYNGEIYNFQELRRQLQACGHQFKSNTDTEVIIHAYEEWGAACLKRFNGMFAFALWDEKLQRLWLARDRIGIKPLFYCHLNDRFLFGSEIKAILCDDSLERIVDLEALSYYLALFYTPAPYTLFRHVRQLLPGHYMFVNSNGQVQDVEYWELDYHEEYNRTNREYIDEFLALLENAVRLRLISDVPFGAFLSGGVDSSSIAYFMAQILREPLKTFSIGFGEPSYDELEYARVVADLIQAEQHEQVVTAEAARVLPELVWYAEEPTADSSMVAVYYLSQMTRKHVSMALSGDGADEIMAGYETYQAYYLRQFYQLIPPFLRHHLLYPAIMALPASDGKITLPYKLKRFVSGAELPADDAHASWRIIFDAGVRKELLSPLSDYAAIQADFLDLYRSLFLKTNAHHPLNRMLYVDTRFYLPNDMLVKIDRMSMAHGLEVRVPFLDHRIVEFLAQVPPSLKLRKFFDKKYILKAGMKNYLPSEIIRRKKEGFNLPHPRWLKKEMKPYLLEQFSPARLDEIGILYPPTVQQLLEGHFSGQVDNSYQIWCLLTLVVWWQRFDVKFA